MKTSSQEVLTESKKPEGYESNLSSYEAQAFDAFCGEPVGWGFSIVQRMSEEKFNGLKSFGIVEYVGNGYVLLTKVLTREEAIQKYGNITEEQFGPRGGWRSVTFGNKKFLSKHLKSQKK
jgi:hypothetical protein